MGDSARAQLAKILVERSYLRAKPGEAFLLSSGRESPFYFDCKATTFFAEALPLIGRCILEEIRAKGTRPAAIGGLTQGADPIAVAAAYASLEMPPVVNAFSVRKQRKEHGTSRWIEGVTGAQCKVAVVDDVVTSGQSTLRAIQCCREEGLEVVHVVVLIDREEGGLEQIQKGIPSASVGAIFRYAELDRLSKQQHGAGADPGSR